MKISHVIDEKTLLRVLEEAHKAASRVIRMRSKEIRSVYKLTEISHLDLTLFWALYERGESEPLDYAHVSHKIPANWADRDTTPLTQEEGKP